MSCQISVCLNCTIIQFGNQSRAPVLLPVNFLSKPFILDDLISAIDPFKWPFNSLAFYDLISVPHALNELILAL